MSFEIIRNDITKVHADAIVNTANPFVAIGAGVDTAIYNAAGRQQLLAERAKIGEIRPGEVAETPAFDLPAKYIIHTVGPAWQGGNHGEIETVAACYSKSMQRAKELRCESIAFPLIASGTYGFPKDVALKTAVAEISGFLFNNEMTVYLVVYDKESFEISGKVFDDITSFIEEDDVIDRSVLSRRMIMIDQPIDNMIYTPQADIDDVIRHKEETFQERLFRIIDRKGLEDKEVYKKANIDRKLFSKIRSNVDYNPSKKTALALAVAMKLNLDETKDLLRAAGIALSRSSIFDIIIQYCIENDIYDIYEINCILFKYDQPILGA